MTNQERKEQPTNIDEQLWNSAQSILAERPDLEKFPPQRITIPDELKPRENEILTSCFENGNPPSDWKQVYLSLFRTNPNNVFLWMRYGNSMGEDNQKTIACWERALEIDQERPNLRCRLSMVYANYGKDKPKETREEYWQKAKDCTKRAVEINPKLFFAWHDLGTIFEDALILDEEIETNHAKDSYREALKVNPEFVPSLIRLGWLLARPRTNDDEAIKLLIKAHQLDPNCGRSQDYVNATMPIGMNRPGILTIIQQKVSQALKST